MKKIITMVGTSIFENYFEENENNNIKNYYEDLEKKRSGEYENTRIDQIKRSIREWFSNNNDRENVSAETKSLVKIRE
ncbi:MAG: hypothetical protein NC931_00430, partial [Candidatus Omnitrophica bacterium]|nr:hypothetical protein [Candidatus Omnitrophota bacterium]